MGRNLRGYLEEIRYPVEKIKTIEEMIEAKRAADTTPPKGTGAVTGNWVTEINEAKSRLFKLL